MYEDLPLQSQGDVDARPVRVLLADDNDRQRMPRKFYRQQSCHARFYEVEPQSKEKGR